MSDTITLTLDEDILGDLRTAALERCWDEQGQAPTAAESKLKLTAQRHGGRSKIFLAAVQALDAACGRFGTISEEVGKRVAEQHKGVKRGRNLVSEAQP